jgi:phosphoglycerate kinase
MKAIENIDVKNKRVLVRADFNVPLDQKGLIKDDFRIQKSLPTIEYLRKNKAKVILLSHLGDPQGKVVESLRLTPVQKRLEEYLSTDITKTDDCVGREVEEKIKKMKGGEILLLENLRFHKEEKENNPEFARELAGLADVYINDAFGSCHRLHASIVGVPQYLPSAAGLLLENEIKVLSQILDSPSRPLVIIVGGAKITSKVKVIRYFLNKADHLLVGGKIANALLIVKGICVGRVWPDEEAVGYIKDIDLTSTKLHLPVDVIVSPTEKGDVYVRETASGKARSEELILDIGPETGRIFSQIIEEAATIVWAGPLGLFEEPLFESGTKFIAEAVVRNKRAFKIAGGGDTIFALAKFHLRERFNHISTGGGAMLAFLSGEKLPGIEALK